MLEPSRPTRKCDEGRAAHERSDLAIPPPIPGPSGALHLMAEEAMGGFEEYFADLRDPRGSISRRHDLLEILTIALCAVLSGGQTAVDMARFAEAKQDFLGRFLRLKNGVPSHDTFSRVFRRLDPDQFRACFRKFASRIGGASGGVIAIDGKVMRRSLNPTNGRAALRMVSAWCCDRRMV